MLGLIITTITLISLYIVSIKGVVAISIAIYVFIFGGWTILLSILSKVQEICDDKFEHKYEKKLVMRYRKKYGKSKLKKEEYKQKVEKIYKYLKIAFYVIYAIFIIMLLRSNFKDIPKLLTTFIPILTIIRIFHNKYDVITVTTSKICKRNTVGRSIYKTTFACSKEEVVSYIDKFRSTYKYGLDVEDGEGIYSAFDKSACCSCNFIYGFGDHSITFAWWFYYVDEDYLVEDFYGFPTDLFYNYDEMERCTRNEKFLIDSLLNDIKQL